MIGDNVFYRPFFFPAMFLLFFVESATPIRLGMGDLNVINEGDLTGGIIGETRPEIVNIISHGVVFKKWKDLPPN